MSREAPYAGLDPERVLDAVDAAGYVPDGRLLALPSYENRVYQVGLDAGGFVVVKFYRPGRWSDAAIAEEHDFAAELAAAELPVVAPLRCAGRTLLCRDGFRYTLYARRGGHAPVLESADTLAWLGRLLARVHEIGARQAFRTRGALDVDSFLRQPAAAVLASGLLPTPRERAYRATIARLDSVLGARFDAVAARRLRLHGDCHAGNVLWTESGPTLVDFDDARMGPAVQDLWMLASDDVAMQQLLEGYEQMRPFDRAELALVPALRALRQVHHAGWIAARWHDPAFPRAFPFAGEPRWWDEHLADLDALIESLA
jgi:Ser/Thr protein kinase RdoA (MazF antagonist)